MRAKFSVMVHAETNGELRETIGLRVYARLRRLPS